MRSQIYKGFLAVGVALGVVAFALSSTQATEIRGEKLEASSILPTSLGSLSIKLADYNPPVIVAEEPGIEKKVNRKLKQVKQKFTHIDKVMYTSESVNLRNVSGDVVRTLDLSEEVKVLGYYNKEWYKVRHKDNLGYIKSSYLTNEPSVRLVSSTAYYDKYNRGSASGRPLYKDHSLAGMVEWLGRSVELYKCNDDGSIGRHIGTYTFDDTGYGQESGVGSSKVLRGRTIGTIENGTCVDIYMNTYDECMNYGRRNVYIKFVD